MPRGIRKNSTRSIPSREWLERQYVVNGLTNRQIAALTGYSLGGMSNLIWRLGLRAGGPGFRQRLDLDRETLYQLHVVEGLTAVRIAARLGCNNGTISRYIRRWGLDPGRRLVNIPRTPPVDRDALWKMYWVEQLSIRQIGQRFGVTATTARRWFELYDVVRRKWNGGEVHRVYARGPESRRDGQEFSRTQREAIFRRDDSLCQMPGCGSAEALEANHILPVKYGGTNAQHNGITLCHSCHASIYRREIDFKVLFDGIVKAKAG